MTLEAGTSPFVTIASINASEVSTAVPSYWDPVTSVILEVTMSIFILFAVVGNILVLVVITIHKGMRTRTNTFLFMLAIVDLLTALLAMPVSLTTVFSGKWIFGEMFCQFNGFLIPLVFVTSIHLLMYIGVHKYLTITRPFDAPLTKLHIGLMISAAWVWGGVIGFLNVYGLNRVHYKAYTTQCGPEYPHDMKTYLHTSIMIVTCYIIPMVVLLFTYSRIFVEIRAYSNRLYKHSDEEKQRIFGQQKRITITLVLVLICFVLCWTPYVVYIIIISLKADKSSVDRNANAIVYWFGYMNSACNPIIYALHSPTFREGFRGVMCLRSSQLDSDGMDSRGLISRLRSFMNDNLVIRSSPRSSPCISALNLHCAQSGTQGKIVDQLKATSLPNVAKISKNARFITLPRRRVQILSTPRMFHVTNGTNNNASGTNTRETFHHESPCHYHNSSVEPYCYIKKITDLTHDGKAAPTNDHEIIIERVCLDDSNDFHEQNAHRSTDGLLQAAEPSFNRDSKRRSVVKSTDNCYVTFNLCRSSVDSVVYEKEVSAACSMDDVFSTSRDEVMSLTSGKVLKYKSEKNIRKTSSTSSQSTSGAMRSVKSDELPVGFSVPRNKLEHESRIWRSKRRKQKFKISHEREFDEEIEDSSREIMGNSTSRIHRPDSKPKQIESTKSDFLDTKTHRQSDESGNFLMRGSKSEAGLISPKHVLQRIFSWTPGKSKRPEDPSTHHAIHNYPDQSKSLTVLSNRSTSQDASSSRNEMNHPLRSYPSIEKLNIKSRSRYKISSISVKYRRTRSRDPRTEFTHEGPSTSKEEGTDDAEHRVSFYLDQGKSKRRLHRSRSDPCIWSSVPQ